MAKVTKVKQGEKPKEVGRVKFPDGSLVRVIRQRVSPKTGYSWVMLLEDHGAYKVGDVVTVGTGEFIQDQE